MANLDLIEARILRLERRSTSQQRLIAVLVIGLAASILIGATDVASTVRCSRLELLGPDGAVAAVLEAHGMGGGTLTLLGPAGAAAVALSGAEGGRITLYGATGDPAVDVGQEDQRGAIALYNDAGRAVVRLTSDSRGDGFVAAYSSRGFGKTLQPRPSHALGIRDVAR